MEGRAFSYGAGQEFCRAPLAAVWRGACATSYVAVEALQKAERTKVCHLRSNRALKYLMHLLFLMECIDATSTGRRPAFTKPLSITTHPECLASHSGKGVDGFSLLLAAAAYQNASPFQDLSPPITPPRRPLQEAVTKYIAVDGDYERIVSIGYGPSYNIDLGTRSPSCPTQYLSIRWSKTYEAFELRIIGPGCLRLGSNTFTQNTSTIILDTATVFWYQGKNFLFRRPATAAKSENAVWHSPRQVSSPAYSLWTSTAEPVAVTELSLAPSPALWPSAQASQERSSQDGEPPHGPLRSKRSPKNRQSTPYTTPATSSIERQPSTPDANANAVRPHISWANLIINAFKSSGKRFLLVSEIYVMIISTYPYFAARKNLKKWKNAVRHALSVNTCFFRLNENEYKCGLWGFHEKTGPTTCRKGKRPTAAMDGLSSPVSSPEAENCGSQPTSAKHIANSALLSRPAASSPTLSLPVPEPRIERAKGLCQINARDLDLDMKRKLDVGSTF
ncbi:uncharacterized protein EV422DRAFT_523120 [Fimicolochytrium jonesii]|uniref:uncharacterized protein n=1 Tax=Fimicolochytrium jonesii TaxID=1396493 RepID=UPI0022FEA012|nr:uncharacterized protein EV422DRAFT_523120 [Fimicolochytrium jonesii]KAI8823034.1 hypothetical protein EV422DRAFT_523120 [Fimicolochytrium jonesii]